MASKVTFIFHVGASSTAPTMLVAAYVDDDTSTSSTGVSCAEQASALFRVIPGVTASPQTPYQQTNKISLKWDAKKAFGGDVIDNNSVTAGTGANPTVQQYFTLVLQDAASTVAATAVINVTAIVEYSAQWLELNSIAAS